MQTEYLPGTTIPHTDETASAFSYIRPLLLAAGGLSLSQICAITGLEGSTVQNWVKRGLVAKPKQKKYDEAQVSRIILINALRDSMQLDLITELLSFVNGSLVDESDNIIPDSQLFNYFCEAVRRLEPAQVFSIDEIDKLAQQVTIDYREIQDGARERLNMALIAMIMAYLSGWLKREAEQYIHTFI